jgi:hypothetical protein
METEVHNDTHHPFVNWWVQMAPRKLLVLSWALAGFFTGEGKALPSLHLSIAFPLFPSWYNTSQIPLGASVTPRPCLRTPMKTWLLLRCRLQRRARWYRFSVRDILLRSRDKVLEATALAPRRLEDNSCCSWPWTPSPWPWHRISCPCPWPGGPRLRLNHCTLF